MLQEQDDGYFSVDDEEQSEESERSDPSIDCVLIKHLDRWIPRQMFSHANNGASAVASAAGSKPPASRHLCVALQIP